MVVKELGEFVGSFQKMTPEKEKQKRDEKSRLICEQNGGQWINGQCIMGTKPKPEPETPKPVEAKLLTAEEKSKAKAAGYNIIKDAQGNEIIQGRVDVERQKALDKTSGLSGAEAVQAKKLQAEEQIRLEQSLSGLGLTPEQIAQIQAQATEGGIDWGEALTAGAANVAPSLVGGAVGGAVIGGVGTGGVGAPLGALIGGAGGTVSGFLGGIKSNIKSQQSGEINSANDVLSAARTNMRQLTILASQYPQSADQYIDQYNQQLAQVYKARAKVKKETTGNLNRFMEDGTGILSEYDLFLTYTAPIYGEKIKMALLDPNHAQLTTEDLQQMEDMG